MNGSAVASSNGSNETATNWSSLTDRRLAAGDYTGYVTVELTRVAGKVAYGEPSISAHGEVNWDWAMPDDDAPTPTQQHAT